MANDYTDPWNRPRLRQPWQLPGPVTTLTLGLILGILCYQAYLTIQDRFGGFSRSYDAAPRPVTPRGDLGQDEQTTIDVYNRSRESVVNVTSQVVKQGRWSMDVFRIPAGTGTGFVWDERGFIVTNNHVIKGASEVEVTMAGEKTRTRRKWSAPIPTPTSRCCRFRHQDASFSRSPLGHPTT